MTALVRAFARAELRTGLVVGGAVTYGVATGAIRLAAYGADDYPVVSAAARGLVYLSPAFMAAAALLTVRGTVSGMARELFLAGVAPQRRRRAIALVGLATCLGAWLVGSAVAALAAVVGTGDVSTVERGSSTAGAVLAVGMVSVVLVTATGCACGVLATTRVAALTAVTLLSAAPFLMLLFGEFPPALLFRSLFPAGAIDGMIDAREGIRGTAALRWGVPAAYLVGSVWLVAFGRRSTDPGAPVPERVTAARPVGPAATTAPLGVLVAGAALLGAVVPQRIAEDIPWWLRGSWLSDLAQGRSSGPVARDFVTAVRAGDRRAERRVVLAGADAIDPVVRRRVRRFVRVSGVRYVYSTASPPGTAIVTLRNGRRRLELTVCSRRTAAGWRVTRTSTDGRC